MTVATFIGDCREVLPTLDAGMIQCCVTSPPYWNLRDYGHPDQIGNEPTVEEYVANLVHVFREVHRVLRDDGTLWLNLGSTYSKGKQLIPVPWLVGLALQQDGWILRMDNIWSKPNAMPENVADRTTLAHEYVLHLSKAQRYRYDAGAIAEPSDTNREYPTWEQRKADGDPMRRGDPGISGQVCKWAGLGGDGVTRNKRSVWTVPTTPYKSAHFATFPPRLIEPCILAGSRVGDNVLDPFAGSGTTGQVATKLSRNCILVELNPEYRPLIDKRVAQRGLILPAEVA